MMNLDWTQDLLAWTSQNPGWTGLVVFAVACVESLVVIGILIPGILVLFGVGAMIGMGAIEITPIWVLGSLGAFIGDLVSYLVGHRYREQLVDIWPFSRYPALMRRGRGFFEGHGNKSVIAGRFIGPLRPIIPATAGMLGMTPGRFIAVDVVACILWTPAYLLPGMLFGASLEVASEYAGRLSLVLIIIAAALWVTWWLIQGVYDFLARRSTQWLGKAAAWSRRHPVMGRIAGPVFDPTQPEAFSVGMLGILLVVTLWSVALLIFFSPFAEHPQAIDAAVLEQARQLRNHMADPFMAAIMQLSRWWVLLPAPAAVLLWLLGAGRVKAAMHWLIAIVGGLLLQLALGWSLRSTPLLASSGAHEFYVPSAALTLSTVVFGFFSVMVAREIKEKHRKWPYLASALVLTLLALARLYLGLDWLSGILAGVLLGFTWTALVGIAYRLRADEAFSGRVVSLIFTSTLALTLAWQVTERLPQDVTRLKPELPSSVLRADAWWDGGWAALPRERTHFESVPAREFSAQLAVSLADIEREMTEQGWEVPTAASWRWAMRALNPEPTVASLPLLGKDYIGHQEALKLRHGPPGSDQQLTLRVWDSGVRLAPGNRPLYLAQFSQETVRQRMAFFSYWRATPVDADELAGWLEAFESKRAAPGLWLFRAPATGIEAASPAAAAGAPGDRPAPAGPGAPGS
ncbi:MAG: phosphatase PAP2 family protein [Xanthomonadales bacterium]|nr:phosphatase PAP2 family protein [Xanthomonadales bacterium]